MSNNSSQQSGFPMAVVVEGGLVLVGILLAWIFGVPLREQFPSDGARLAQAFAWGVFATLPMLIVFWVLVHSKRPAWRQLREQVEQLLAELFPTNNVAQFALVAVLAGVGEELLFRGVLQTLLIRWTNLEVGLIAASVLFGLAHALSRVYFFLATLIGLYLGCCLIQFNDVVTPMVAHALYDFVALVYLSRHLQPR